MKKSRADFLNFNSSNIPRTGLSLRFLNLGFLCFLSLFGKTVLAQDFRPNHLFVPIETQADTQATLQRLRSGEIGLNRRMMQIIETIQAEGHYQIQPGQLRLVQPAWIPVDLSQVATVASLFRIHQAQAVFSPASSSDSFFSTSIRLVPMGVRQPPIRLPQVKIDVLPSSFDSTFNDSETLHQRLRAFDSERDRWIVGLAAQTYLYLTSRKQTEVDSAWRILREYFQRPLFLSREDDLESRNQSQLFIYRSANLAAINQTIEELLETTGALERAEELVGLINQSISEPHIYVSNAHFSLNMQILSWESRFNADLTNAFRALFLNLNQKIEERKSELAGSNIRTMSCSQVHNSKNH